MSGSDRPLEGSIQLLLTGTMKDFSVKLTEMIEDRLQTFKRQIMEDNSSSLESAMKKMSMSKMNSHLNLQTRNA